MPGRLSRGEIWLLDLPRLEKRRPGSGAEGLKAGRRPRAAPSRNGSSRRSGGDLVSRRASDNRQALLTEGDASELFLEAALR